jgi:disulfide bond formation protein DsbB
MSDHSIFFFSLVIGLVAGLISPRSMIFGILVYVIMREMTIPLPL